MGIIPCTEGCIYESEGVCTLDRVCRSDGGTSGCIHYVPR